MGSCRNSINGLITSLIVSLGLNRKLMMALLSVENICNSITYVSALKKHKFPSNWVAIFYQNTARTCFWHFVFFVFVERNYSVILLMFENGNRYLTLAQFGMKMKNKHNGGKIYKTVTQWNLSHACTHICATVLRSTITQNSLSLWQACQLSLILRATPTF